MKKFAAGFASGVASVVVAFAAILIFDDEGDQRLPQSEYH